MASRSAITTIGSLPTRAQLEGTVRPDPTYATGVDPAVVTGAFTLGGVVAGGGLTATIEGWRDRRARWADTRAAVRLLQDEAKSNQSALELLHDKETPATKFDDLRDSIERGYISHSTWIENRGLLARELEDDEWQKVERAYLGVRLLLTVRGEDKLGVRFGSESGPAMIQLLNDVETSLGEAIESLAGRATQPQPRFLRR
jgi:hypothetical protein